MNTLRLALALLLAGGLTACGNANPYGPGLSGAGARSDISSAESAQLDSVNEGGLLDDLDDTALTSLAPADSTDASATDPSLAPSGETVQGLSGLFGKTSTKCGYIRSDADGKFYLQYKKGFIHQSNVSLPIAGKDEAEQLKVAKYLNDKVLVRGLMSGSTLNVSAVYDIPDLGVVMNLIKDGCVHGKIYDAKTFVAKAGAAITLQSLANNQIYRAVSKSSGEYHVPFLAPGDYTLKVTLAGYASGSLAKVTIKKRKTTAANVPLTTVMLLAPNPNP
jgi:hypothetical protein